MVVRRKVQVEEVVGCKVYEAKAVQSLPETILIVDPRMYDIAPNSTGCKDGSK